MKYPLPIKIVKGRFPVVTQEFGNQSNNSWYESNGIKFDATSSGGHNGTDIVIGGGKTQSVDTYGTELVCPFPKGLPTKVWWESPMSTKGNGIQIQTRDERGTIYILCWHCSECKFAEEYNQGDTIGYIGNSGLVNPAPSYFSVHAGAHLHLGAWINGVMVNPRDIFDFTQWFVSDVDTGVEKDLPPFQYFINKFANSIKNLLGVKP